jgi:hypothetical protein
VFGRGEVGPVRRAEREIGDFQLRSRFATSGRDVGGLDGWSSYARFGAVFLEPKKVVRYCPDSAFLCEGPRT